MSLQKFFPQSFTLHTWNRLPFHIRIIPNEPQFKHKVTDFLWTELLNSVGDSIPIF